MKEKRTGGQFRTSIGGQALIEGILMRGPKKQAIVVRSPEGLVREVEELHLIKDKYPILGWPIIRGAVTFVDSMVRGVKALMFSADYFPELEESEPSKLDRWLEAHVSEQKLQSVMVWVSVILSLGMSIALFLLLPTFIAGLFHAQTPGAAQPDRGRREDPRPAGPISSSARSRRTSSACSPTTGPSIRRSSAMRLGCHSRSKTPASSRGTIRAAARAFCSWSSSSRSSVSSIVFPYINWQNLWVRIGVKLLLLIPVVGVTYEFNRFVGGTITWSRGCSPPRHVAAELHHE